MTLYLLLCTILSAKTMAGVTLPDSMELNGDVLILNGLGLREKYWVDVYVAGLYFPLQTSNPQTIISTDTTKRIHTKFIYSNVPKQKMIDTLMENIQQNPNISHQTISQIDEAALWMEDFTTGDEIIFDYIPGTGTVFTIKGEVKGTILGKDFMEALFGIYVGEYPASIQLKEGLLGIHTP